MRASPSTAVAGGQGSRSKSRRCHRSGGRRRERSSSGESDAGSDRSGARARGGNFRESGLHGCRRPGARGLRRSDPWCGEGSEGVRGPLLCASGTRKVWRDGSGSALREVDSFAREKHSWESTRNQRRRAEEPAEVKGQRLPRLGRPLFGPTGGEGLEAQVAALAGELGLDPPMRQIEPKNLNAPRSSQLEGRDGDLTPRGEAWGPSGRNKDVESRMSRDILPSAAYWTPSASTPLVSPLEMVLQEKLKEARARLSRKRRGRKWLLQVLAERVLKSTADALVTADLASRRRKCNKGTLEDVRKRNQRERGRENKKRERSSSSGQTVESSSSSDEGLGREDESKVRRTAATKPGALLHSGLIMVHR